LASTVAGLREWVIPVVLGEQRGDSDSAMAMKAVKALADTLNVPVNTVNSMDQLDEILPTLVARARRTYLREGAVDPAVVLSRRPGRLRDENQRNAEAGDVDE